MYRDWGFKEPPFQTTSLAANEMGSTLLIGRVREVEHFTVLLESGPRAVTIEGGNGVGKTSLVNVAIYRAMTSYLSKTLKSLFVPAIEPLQITDHETLEPFLDRVYSLLARTLIQRAREIRHLGWDLPNTHSLDQWLNSPLIERFGASLGPLGWQRSAEINDNEAYRRGGFRVEVCEWLRSVFPAQAGGGVVCLIDNLELLRTSARARQLVEELRDPIFGIPGVRWVLCGANGIARSVAGSPRLDGYLHAPIDVGALGNPEAREIFRSRMRAYSRTDVASYLPLREEDFVRLFDILASNTRSVLRYADTYCLAQAADVRHADADRAENFEAWLTNESHASLNDCDGQVGKRAWSLFDQACNERPNFAPSDFVFFGFNKQSVMVPHVIMLEQNGLVVSAADETDRRRRTITVTPKGWLVRYARSRV